ncbi:hypothetical protein RQP46_001427 [Phenoliferia psychrophenolica]
MQVGSLRLCLLWLASWVAIAAAASNKTSGAFSIVSEPYVQLGDPVVFSWSGPDPPYTIEIILGDAQVVSRVTNWDSNSIQWTADAKDAPVGTRIRLKISGSSVSAMRLWDVDWPGRRRRIDFSHRGLAKVGVLGSV